MGILYLAENNGALTVKNLWIFLYANLCIGFDVCHQEGYVKQNIQHESQFETIGEDQVKWMIILLLCLLHLFIPNVLADGTAGAKGSLGEKLFLGEGIYILEHSLGLLISEFCFPFG